MNIVFRVDSSIKIGVGHLMRCLALADEFKRRHHKVTFICRGLRGNSNALVKQKNHKIFTLPVNIEFQSDSFYLDWLGGTQEQDAEQTLAIMPKNTDLLIIDSYALDEIWHKRLKTYVKIIMVIDDLADRNFDCDVLLNQNLGAQKEEYKNKVPDDCELLLGCDYALLRSEFSKLRVRMLEKRRNTKEIKNILVSMGGSDIKNLTYDILRAMDDGFNVTVILGSSSPHNEMIQEYVKDKNITVIVDSNNMPELMLESDLAIGTGGSTSWERCCLGLPTLLFVVDDNQRRIASNLEKIGAVKVVNNFESDFKEVWENFEAWVKMFEKSKIICDGLGVQRVINNVK